MSQIIELKANEPTIHHAPVTPMDMLDRAISSGAGIEVLEKLMALQERYEANQARKAFDNAISLAKAEISPVVRNKKGHNSTKYADFSAISNAIDHIITAHGLSYRFKSAQSDRITVTCVLSHRDGHSEETTLSGPPDATGNKNAIQAIGSTITYLQRYTLIQSLGIAVTDDDDGTKAKSAEDPKSSAQLKREGAWEDVTKAIANEMLDVHSLVGLEKVRKAYREKVVKDQWPKAWQFQLKDVFDGYEDLIRDRMASDTVSDIQDQFGNARVVNESVEAE
jgi:ERF superfamily.